MDTLMIVTFIKGNWRHFGHGPLNGPLCGPPTGD